MRLRRVHTQRPHICSKMILHMTAHSFSVQNLLTGQTLATGGHRQYPSRPTSNKHANLFPNSRFRTLIYYIKRHVLHSLPLHLSHLSSNLPYPPPHPPPSNSHPLLPIPPNQTSPPLSSTPKTPPFFATKKAPCQRILFLSLGVFKRKHHLFEQPRSYMSPQGYVLYTSKSRVIVCFYFRYKWKESPAKRDGDIRCRLRLNGGGLLRKNGRLHI
jgi:hypothetical protein